MHLLHDTDLSALQLCTLCLRRPVVALYLSPISSLFVCELTDSLTHSFSHLLYYSPAQFSRSSMHSFTRITDLPTHESQVLLLLLLCLSSSLSSVRMNRRYNCWCTGSAGSVNACGTCPRDGTAHSMAKAINVLLIYRGMDFWLLQGIDARQARGQAYQGRQLPLGGAPQARLLFSNSRALGVHGGSSSTPQQSCYLHIPAAHHLHNTLRCSLIADVRTSQERSSHLIALSLVCGWNTYYLLPLQSSEVIPPAINKR